MNDRLGSLPLLEFYLTTVKHEEITSAVAGLDVARSIALLAMLKFSAVRIARMST